MKKKEKPLNAEQVSFILSINEVTVKKLAKEGELPCTYIKRQPWFYLTRLIKHFERLEGGAA